MHWLLTRSVNHHPNTTTMVVPFADSAAWQWQISPPHPGEPLLKGLAVDGMQGFIQFYNQAEKNCLQLLTVIYYIFSMLLITIAPKMMTLHPQHDHSRSNLLSCITYLMSVSFWLVVVFTIITWWPSKAKLYFICDYFFCPSNCCPKRCDNFPHLL